MAQLIKNLPAGDPSSAPGWGRSAGEGNGNPLQYSCWKIRWTEELVDYSPWGFKESDTTEQLNHQELFYVLSPRAVFTFYKNVIIFYIFLQERFLLLLNCLTPFPSSLKCLFMPHINLGKN